MKPKISFIDEYMGEVSNKTLCELKEGQLFISNIINIKHINFFKDIISEFDEIIYYKHDKPTYPRCGCDMLDNGSREIKTNKLECIRKKQYICPNCNKTQVTSLEPYISKYSNYSYDIM